MGKSIQGPFAVASARALGVAWAQSRLTREAGTLAENQLFETLTSAAASLTEAGDTLAATATVEISATASPTEAADIVAGIAQCDIQAQQGGTEEPDTLAATFALEGEAPAPAGSTGGGGTRRRRSAWLDGPDRRPTVAEDDAELLEIGRAFCEFFARL